MWGTGLRGSFSINRGCKVTTDDHGFEGWLGK